MSILGKAFSLIYAPISIVSFFYKDLRDTYTVSNFLMNGLPDLHLKKPNAVGSFVHKNVVAMEGYLKIYSYVLIGIVYPITITVLYIYFGLQTISMISLLLILLILLLIFRRNFAKQLIGLSVSNKSLTSSIGWASFTERKEDIDCEELIKRIEEDIYEEISFINEDSTISYFLISSYEKGDIDPFKTAYYLFLHYKFAADGYRERTGKPIRDDDLFIMEMLEKAREFFHDNGQDHDKKLNFAIQIFRASLTLASKDPSEFLPKTQLKVLKNELPLIRKGYILKQIRCLIYPANFVKKVNEILEEIEFKKGSKIDFNEQKNANNFCRKLFSEYPAIMGLTLVGDKFIEDRSAAAKLITEFIDSLDINKEEDYKIFNKIKEECIMEPNLFMNFKDSVEKKELTSLYL